MKKRDPGFTYPDATKVEIPVRFRGAVSEGDRLMQLIHRYSELQRDSQYVETLEEANDFEVQDGFDEDFGESRYQMTDMQEDREFEKTPPAGSPPAEATPPAAPTPESPQSDPQKP